MHTLPRIPSPALSFRFETRSPFEDPDENENHGSKGMSKNVISTLAFVLVIFILFLVALYLFRKTQLLKRFFVWSGLQRLWKRRTEGRDTDRASIQLKRTTRVPSDGTTPIRVPLPREPERVYAGNGQGRGARKLSSDSDTLVNVAV